MLKIIFVEMKAFLTKPFLAILGNWVLYGLRSTSEIVHARLDQLVSKYLLTHSDALQIHSRHTE